MTPDPKTAVQAEVTPDELVEMAEAFERRDFSDEELEAIRETCRSTPRSLPMNATLATEEVQQ